MLSKKDIGKIKAFYKSLSDKAQESFINDFLRSTKPGRQRWLKKNGKLVEKAGIDLSATGCLKADEIKAIIGA